MDRPSHPTADLWVTVARPRVGEAGPMRRLLCAIAASSALLVVLVGPAAASNPAGGPRDHVWIPSLGISRSVHVFPCPRQRPPDDLVYAWACAGENNVYLMGHAHSVFKPLHDAYVAGRLPAALTVVYADHSGRRRTYRVAWWRLTEPTPDAAWAWAPQSRASMTLQTCVGRDDEYRLMVRLIEEIPRIARVMGSSGPLSGPIP